MTPHLVLSIVCLVFVSPLLINAETMLGLLASGRNSFSIGKVDPTTGQAGPHLWTTTQYGLDLPAQQPAWDAEQQLLYVATTKPHGLLEIDCKNLSSIDIKSFTPFSDTIRGPHLVAVLANQGEGMKKTIYGIALTYPIAQLVIIDPSTQTYKVVASFERLSNGAPLIPQGYPLGGTSIAIDTINRLLVVPTYLQEQFYLLTINLDNYQQQSIYNYTNNPLFGLQWSSNVKKMYGMIDEPDQEGNDRFFWVTIDASKGSYTNVGQWTNIPNPNYCAPVGNLNINPSTNMAYTVYGAGWNCGSPNIQLYVVEGSTGVIKAKLNPRCC